MIINLSTDSDYHTQLNNKLVPLESCNTTSAIMFLLACGVEIPDTGAQQPEDALTALLEMPEAFEMQKELAPWSIGQFRPQEVHTVLDWGVNKFVGADICRFRDDATQGRLAYELAHGRAAIVSGRFTPAGHVVCLVGVDTDQVDVADVQTAEDVELDRIRAWIIDDPYGDWHTDYHDQHGNNVRFTPAEFDRLTQQYYQDKKWAHLYVGGKP